MDLRDYIGGGTQSYINTIDDPKISATNALYMKPFQSVTVLGGNLSAESARALHSPFKHFDAQRGN